MRGTTLGINPCIIDTLTTRRDAMFGKTITITIDTNIFDATTYDLSEDSTLRLLQSYVKDGKIKVVLSDIVVREVKAHLKREASGMMSAIKNSRNDYLKKLNKDLWIAAGAKQYIYISKAEKYYEKMIEIFNQYLKDIDAEIIMDTSNIDINEILDDYFDFNAPFENSEKKRKEFPDAFIASQIRTAYPKHDSIVIISDDNGFKKACNKNGEYLCYSSLGDLFNEISKQNKLYNETLEVLVNNNNKINKLIRKEIQDTQDITVYGQSYDRKGISYGHDYSDTLLKSVSNISHELHVIDDIEGDEAIITLACHGDFEMLCYYEDYDNAPWDNEKKEYVYVNNVQVLEKHQPNFPCRIRLNINNGEVKILPLQIHLGGDSRKEIIENYDYYDDDDTDELLDEEREELGFHSLSHYDDYVENQLRESDMNKEIIDALNEYHRDLSVLEYLSASCDEFSDQYNKNNSDNKAVLISNLKANLAGFRFEHIDKPVSYEEVDLLSWLDKIFDKGEIYDEVVIPEELELNNIFSIKGIEDSLTISINGLSTNHFSEGDKEWIDIMAFTDGGMKASGIIDLTVGYLDFDDNGCAGDGIEDDVSFEYTNIIDTVEKFVLSQKKILKEYNSLKVIIDNSLNQ